MTQNKTRPTATDVGDYLETVPAERKSDSLVLIEMMKKVSKEQPVLWGTGIIGFGSQHYTYDTGREGDMPKISFSLRKATVTIYFMEGFDRYSAEMSRLGSYTSSVSCLYVKKLQDIDLHVLESMLKKSYALTVDPQVKPSSVHDYIAQVPSVARSKFDELRALIKKEAPHAQEVLSYGVVGYKVDDKRARIFVAGWKDHVSLYPIPKDSSLQDELQPYRKGPGTLWFALDTPLPSVLLRRVVRALLD